MTFMIAYVRNAGGGTMAQSAFWTCIGIGAFVQPWVWSGAMAKAVSGRLTAALLAITAIGALIPLVGNTPFLLAISAIMFGNAFFAVMSSATAFARLNYPPSAWPHSIARMTLSFGIGQTLGPIATGAMTDASGSLSYALDVSYAGCRRRCLHDSCRHYDGRHPTKSAASTRRERLMLAIFFDGFA